MKILIAEDEPVSRRMLESTLERWEHEVVSTRDGREAWQALQGEDRPALAILDWMMPEIDGVELCRKIRADPSLSLLYVILLTAQGSKEDIVKGLDAGANDYVSKPFNYRELRARIRVGERVVQLETALSQRVSELESALEHIKTLQGILPICMHCHKIRTDAETWHRLEGYIEEHSEARFSHGLCPECLEKHYPETE